MKKPSSKLAIVVSGLNILLRMKTISLYPSVEVGSGRPKKLHDPDLSDLEFLLNNDQE